jgi:hypothetical protein
VRDFNNTNEVRRKMIGMKDFTSVNIGRNSQTHTEKKVGSVELKEIYELFKSKFPTENLGLTKIC